MRRSPRFLFSVCLLAACATPPPPPELDGTVWKLTSLEQRDVLADATVTLRFEGGRAEGSDGCNSYSAPYQQDGDWLDLGDVAATQMACAEPVMDQAGVYQVMLDEVRSANREGDQLTLRDAEAVDVAEFVLQSQSLEGSAWRVTGYDGGGHTIVSVLEATELTLTFAEGGRVGGSAGCNHFSGAYVSTGPDLVIEGVGATRKACAEPAGVMEQEAGFLTALPLAAKARVDGDRLELRTLAGVLVLTAVRSPNP